MTERRLVLSLLPVPADQREILIGPYSSSSFCRDNCGYRCSCCSKEDTWRVPLSRARRHLRNSLFRSSGYGASVSARPRRGTDRSGPSVRATRPPLLRRGRGARNPRPEARGRALYFCERRPGEALGTWGRPGKDGRRQQG
ncbi:hypothetical protein NDU88_004535 [Pleurodeles waltl]|uniref:Uncharacterized protein n=1 Tax=Pleurodeles waltl TaxID=8319 RepID=A0AAV7M8M4_PLEWA|nr:hypothetical protein NDU88_004535 [Pleurodeles waltl]